MTAELRVGTRRSALARAQAQWVAERLRARWPGQVTLIPLTTAGDRSQEQNPAVGGGRGVFVRELEDALLAGEVDLCVHSAKDVPPQLPEGLTLAALPPRADPRDALITASGGGLQTLWAGARVGTGSPRRALQLADLRPDLTVVPMRGNVDTRLGRVSQGELDAVVLAVAGLVRLARGAEVAQALNPAEMVPAAGQGALALETRGDHPHLDVFRSLDHPATALAVLSERAVLGTLGGGCAAPAGALTTREPDGSWMLRAVVGGVRSGRLVRALVRAGTAEPAQTRAQLVSQAVELAARAVEELLASGAQALLEEAEGGAP